MKRSDYLLKKNMNKASFETTEKREGKKRSDYLLKTPLQVTTVNNYFKSVNSFSQQMADDFKSRDGVYQSAESFGTYRDDTDKKITSFSQQSKGYRDYFSKNRALYGDETVNSILSSLDEVDNYLSGARSGMQSEYDYWSSFGSEREYTDYQDYEKAKKLDVDATNARVAEIEKQIAQKTAEHQTYRNSSEMQQMFRGGEIRRASGTAAPMIQEAFSEQTAYEKDIEALEEEKRELEKLLKKSAVIKLSEAEEKKVEAARAEAKAKYENFDIESARAKLDDAEYWIGRIEENRRKTPGKINLDDSAIKTERKQLEDDIKGAQSYQEEKEKEERLRGFYSFQYAEDFEQGSKYSPKENGKKAEDTNDNFGVAFLMADTPAAYDSNYTETGYDDNLYEYINGNTDVITKIKANERSNKLDVFGMDWSYLEELTEDEIGIYNYVHKKSEREAEEFISLMKPELLSRQRARREKEMEEYATKNPVESSVFSIVTSPKKVIPLVGQTLDYLSRREIDKNAGYNRFIYEDNAIRGAVSEIVEEKWGEPGTFFYNTGMSMGEFLVSTVATGGNSTGALAIMGSNAAASTTLNALDRGLSSGQAFTLGTIAGAAEIMTERISWNALFDAAKLGNSAVGYLWKNTISEGAEEGISGLVNLFADVLISQDKSEWQQSIDLYKAMGKSESEAFGLAFGDQAKAIGLDVLGGGLSGFAMASLPAAIHRYVNRNSEQTVAPMSDSVYNENTTEGGVLDGQGEKNNTGIRGWNANNNTEKPLSGSLRNGGIYEADSNATKFGIHEGTSGENVHTSDSEGRIIDGELKDFLQDTAVKNDKGEIVAVYHGTPEMNFKNFEISKDIGFHFGGINQAQTRIKDLGAESGRLFRVYLNIKSPVRARKDIMNWHANAAALYLWSDGYLTNAELAEVQSLEVDDFNSPAAVRLREILAEKGYDGIVYPNGFEGDGDSYIAFSDDQIVKTEIRNTERGAENADLAQNGRRFEVSTSSRGVDGSLYGGERGQGPQGIRSESSGEVASEYGQNPRRNGEVSASTPAGSIAEAYGATGVEKSAIYSAYELGRQNTPREAVPLEGPAQEEAYNAGRIEYIRNMPNETSTGQKTKVSGEGVKHFGKDAKLVRDENFKKSKMKSREARELDGLAQVTETQIRFAEKVFDEKGRETNASYKDGVITISLKCEDPFKVAAIHEVVHRLKETNPEAYKALSDFVLENMSDDSILTSLEIREEAYESSDAELLSEEVVCDAFGRMLNDSEILDRFAKDNRRGLEKVRDIFRDLIISIQRALKKDSKARLTDYQKQEFRELSDKLSEMEKLLSDALESAAQTQRTQKNTAEAVGSGAKYSISSSFAREIDSWDGKSKKSFVVGRTSDVLKGLGVEDRRIIWHGGKIAEVLRKHSNMSKEIIKQVPQIMETPVIILKSQNSNSRITMFGEVRDSKGNLVLAVLELEPTARNGRILNMNVVASAYGKDSNPNGFVKNSELLYLDPNKNRTQKWMQSVGLQLPSGTNTLGSIGTITYKDGKVNIQGVPYNQFMQGNYNNTASSGNNKPKSSKRTKDITQRVMNERQYTEQEYKSFGWARANGILNEGENADYRSKFAMAKSGQAKFKKSKNGEYIIPVSDIYDEAFEGIDNTLVFAKGTIENPIITSIIKILEYDETTLDETRRYIYDLERRGFQPKAGNTIRRYHASDFRDSWNRQAEKSHGDNNGERYGNGRKENTGTVKGHEVGNKASLKTKDITDRVMREKLKDARLGEKIAGARENARLKREQAERIAKISESRKRKELKERIQKHVSKLSEKLLHPTDEKHIPKELKETVAALLNAINLESNYSFDEESGSYKKNDEGLPAKRTEKFRELREIYEKIISEGTAAELGMVIDPELLGVADEGVRSKFSDAIAMKDLRIADMTSAELQTVWDVLRAVEHSISMAGKMFSAGRYETVSEAANAVLNGADAEVSKSQTKLGQAVNASVEISNLSPEAFFHRLGKGGDAIYRTLRNAEDKQTVLLKETADFMIKATENVDLRKLESKTHKTVLGGEEVEMSTAQIMELYLLGKRKQAVEHLTGGGITLEMIPEKKEQTARSTSIGNITEEEIDRAVDLLTHDEIELADLLSEYASKTLGGHMNEECLRVFGYEKFNDPNYWPIRTDPRGQIANKKSANAKKGVPLLRNVGMSKPTVQGAKNPIFVGSIFDTFAEHTAQATTYAAWLGATEDVRRIFNFSFERSNPNTRFKTMQNVIDGVFGVSYGKDRRIKSPGIEYWEKLYEDISAGMQASEGGSPFETILGNARAAAVGANLRVVIQQPTAIIRANAMISGKYLVAGAKHPIDGWEKALKYAPIAQQKEWSRIDIRTGRSTKDIIFLGSESALEKTKGAGMWLASKADALSWGLLWNACEAELRAKYNKDHVPTKKTPTKSGADALTGTEEFYDAVAKRFTEIVEHTQVVDGVLQRSQTMRSSNSLTKMAAAFMGEPTKQLNMLMTSIYDYRHAKTNEERVASRKQLGRTVFSLLLSQTINACAQSIVDAIRDDDREKKFWEKWLDALTGAPDEMETGMWKRFVSYANGNLGDIINPLGYVPYAKDIWSLISGYDVSRQDVDSIGDLISAASECVKAFSGESKKTLFDALSTLASTAATMFGIPLENLKRDIRAGVLLGAVESENYLMEYRMDKFLKNIEHSGNLNTFVDVLYRSYENDREAYEIIYADMVKSGIDPKDIATRMESRMKKQQGVKKVSELEQRYLSPTQEKAYNRELSNVKKSSVWSKAASSQRKDLEEDIYDLSVQNDDGKKLREKMYAAEKYGIDSTEYLLFLLACDMADKPNKSGKMGGRVTKDEFNEAVKMLGLSRKERNYLWETR